MAKSSPSLEFGNVSVLDIEHSNRSVIVSRCFDLHFPDDIKCGTSFHMLISHQCIFFGEFSVNVFDSFLNDIICLKFYGYSPLSEISFINIFSQSVCCLLILLTLSFVEQKIYIFN